MEHNRGGLVQIVFFLNGVICRFQVCIFELEMWKIICCFTGFIFIQGFSGVLMLWNISFLSFRVPIFHWTMISFSTGPAPHSQSWNMEWCRPWKVVTQRVSKGAKVFGRPKTIIFGEFAVKLRHWVGNPLKKHQALKEAGIFPFCYVFFLLGVVCLKPGSFLKFVGDGNSGHVKNHVFFYFFVVVSLIVGVVSFKTSHFSFLEDHPSFGYVVNNHGDRKSPK